jgi:signal transduction histidine kinase
MTASLPRWARRRARSLVRPTIRLRLTLVYGALFAAAGAVLLTITYVLVDHDLSNRASVLAYRSMQSGGATVQAVRPGEQLQPGADTRRYVDPSRLQVDGESLYQRAQRLAAQLNQATLSTLMTRSLMALGLMALAALGLGWVVAGRVLRPLAAITATAKRCSTDTLHQRIALDGPDDELKELADTIDGMLERLDTSFASQRRFAANASHELRTPLAIMRAALDVGLRGRDTGAADPQGMDQTLREAVDRSEHLVDSLLLLARSEQTPPSREPLDLAAAAQDALDAWRAERASLGLRVSDRLEPAVVAGDRVLLERTVANLVENAVRHNQPGGWIELSSGTDDRGMAWVRVANSGRRIPPEQVPELFEPFRRLGGDRVGSRGGAGLGLSIVRTVARVHGGSTHAEPLAVGGLAVTLTLPTARRQAPATPVPAVTSA